MKLELDLMCKLTIRYAAQDNRLTQATKVKMKKSLPITHSSKIYDRLASLTPMALRHRAREFSKEARPPLQSQIVTGLPRGSSKCTQLIKAIDKARSAARRRPRVCIKVRGSESIPRI